VKFVLIQTRRDVEKARLDLELKMDDELEDKIVFYSGERTSAEDIGKLRLEKAVEIFILGESADFENEKDHDSFNVNCLEHISSYFKEFKHWNRTWNKRVRVHVDFEYQSTFTAFKATHLYQKLDKDIEFVPFNVHETWARNRMDQGWTFGEKRNDELRQHPSLVPYDELSEEEKAYDRDTAISTLKFITRCGFQISKK
jgi:ryanodine receptor 2